GFPRVTNVTASLFSRGAPLCDGESAGDFAVAHFDVDSGATIRLACSWKLPAGRDAVISGAFFGTRGGAAFHNVNGSFYEFAAERFDGTRAQTLAGPPGEWCGRATVDWTRRLAAGNCFDPAIDGL